MEKDYSINADLMFVSSDGHKISRMAKLEMLCIALEQLINEDGAFWPPHQQLVEIKDSAYEFLGAADNFFGHDPTPQFLYDNTGGEPPVSSQELWMTDFNKKQQLTR